MNANANRPTTLNELLQTFPNLRKVQSLDRLQFDIASIPKIFLPSLDLSQKDNFDAVFPFAKDGLLTEDCYGGLYVKQMQETLSHYLDIVEVRLAEQVTSKSQAFFHEMTPYDMLMKQLTQTITVLKPLRKNIHQVDQHLVKNSLEILQ